MVIVTKKGTFGAENAQLTRKLWNASSS